MLVTVRCVAVNGSISISSRCRWRWRLCVTRRLQQHRGICWQPSQAIPWKSDLCKQLSQKTVLFSLFIIQTYPTTALCCYRLRLFVAYNYLENVSLSLHTASISIPVYSEAYLPGAWRGQPATHKFL